MGGSARRSAATERKLIRQPIRQLPRKSPMPEAVSDVSTTRGRAAYPCKTKAVRPVLFTAVAGVLALFLNIAEAGNVQFSRTVPAVVASDAAVNAAQTQQPSLIRRGRESATAAGQSRMSRSLASQE